MNLLVTRCCVMLLLLATLIVGGCSPFAPSQRSARPEALPQHYSLYRETGQTLQPWWCNFGSPELNGLMDSALAGNFSVREAWARLQQAQASARKSRSEQWPDLALNGEASHYRQKTSDGGSVISDGENYSLGLVSSYELDLWGRVEASVRASDLESQASALDWQTAVVSLSAEVSEYWLRLQAQQQLVAVAQQQISAAEHSLELLRWRFVQGQSPRIDLIRQQEQLAQRQAALAPLEQEQQRLRHELNLLLGRAPRTPLPHPTALLPQPSEIPAIGLPADLLAQRPDVRAAGLRLQAADWLVSAARADRLPAIRLTAGGSLQSPQMSDLLDNWLLNLASSLTGPIFDGHSRAAEVARVRAVVDERLARYEQTVLTAVTEVENALTAEHKLAEELAALTTQLTRAQQVVEAGLERYRQGIIDYRTVLSDRQNLYSLQLQQVQRHRDLLLARITLHRVLGGHIISEGSQQVTAVPPSFVSPTASFSSVKGAVHG